MNSTTDKVLVFVMSALLAYPVGFFLTTSINKLAVGAMPGTADLIVIGCTALAFILGLVRTLYLFSLLFSKK